MKKYNINNYIRYKEDLKSSIPEDKPYTDYTRDEMIVKFMPLVETLARKFSTADQASGVLTIMDLIQAGNESLTRAVDRLEWETLEKSEDIEKTLKSFFSKRIKGGIRRRIDISRGNIKIPEHALNKIRKSPEDERMVAMFFNSIFSSIDDKPRDENPAYNIPDKSKQYNIHLLNAYLLGLMKEYLTHEQYEVIRLSYGLDCDKHSAAEIANKLNMKMNTAVVRVSQIKRDAIKKLIDNTDPSQVIDYL
jgi:RNA polymerase sigma factor (sigma-70 family)